MEGMFYNCYSLTSINLSNFDTSKVNNMNSMFYGCSSLTSINLSNFNTSKVNDMDFMFYGCSKLQFIDISYFSISAYEVNLFNQQIPFNGTLITNENFKNIINKTYINGWKIEIN